MPAFNFIKQFADDVESGKKRQTIRAKRKDGNRPKVTQTAYLYTGMRHSSCRKLGEYPITEVHDILVGFRGIWIDKDIIICEKPELEAFANADGFDSWAKMQRYFLENGGLPFTGDFIKW